MDAWTVEISPHFSTTLQNIEIDLKGRQDRLRAEGWPSPDKEYFVLDVKQFLDFQQGLRAVTASDPLSHLQFYSKDSNESQYYRLKDGNDWQAYYAVDTGARSVVALAAFYLPSLSRKKILADLSTALKNYNEANV